MSAGNHDAMKLILLIISLICVGCQAPSEVHLADGTVIKRGGQLGGKHYERYTRSADGAVSYTNRPDLEGSFRDGATAVVSAVGLYQAGLSNRATTLADAAVATGGQKAAVATEATRAGVEKARIAADVTKTITVPK